MSLCVDMLQPVVPDVPAQKQKTSPVTITIVLIIVRAEVATFPTETSVSVRSAGFLLTISV